MSVISTSANYGGKVADNQQGIKQFYISGPSIANWIYKRLNSGLLVQTPSNSKIPVLINSDVIITGSIFNTSDQNLKQNICKIDKKEMEDLFTLNPILFTYKNDLNNKKHYGVLAQEVEKVFPELVKDNMLGYKTVNYQEFIPLMLSKQKDMQNEINELKALINSTIH